MHIQRGNCIDLLAKENRRFHLIVTDPPYAFGGAGDEHALSADVAIGLREAAKLLLPGHWMLVFCASSWRSTIYMVESLRGILTPVRIGTWTKPKARTKAKTAGWKYASVNVVAFRNGKSIIETMTDALDHITAAPITQGRRAELPPEVAQWAVHPYSVKDGNFLDPFAGSGILLKAAETAGMNATGYEIKPYFPR